MQNHLVIGLGGTGGCVIRALRKRIWQEHRDHQIPGLGLEYLYVDSDPELMNQDHPTWKTLGTSVQLPNANQLHIGGADLGPVIADPRAYPRIAPWIGDPGLWAQVPNNVVTGGRGGQRRRLGRFLFAMSAQPFQNALVELSRQVRARTGTVPINYYVVTGLAGGTGSGSLIDVIAQIGRLPGIDPNDRLVIYAILPESAPGIKDAGNYHANGYGALLELNGLMIRRYQPWNVLDGNGRIAISDLLKRVYLITNQNANGIQVNQDTELPEIVSDYLYESIIEQGRNAQSPIQTFENFNAAPENIAGTNEPVRAREFSGFGIKRVAVPEEEITEYLTFSFARQAVLQLHFNNWNNLSGFQATPPPVNFAAIVSDDAVQTRWLLADAHLMLDLPILPQDVQTAKKDNWQPDLAAEWLVFSPWNVSEAAKFPYKEKCGELLQRFENYFNDGFRGRGVVNFYQEIGDEGQQTIARYLVERIEAECFNDWRLGTRSAQEIVDLLTALTNHLTQRKTRLDARRTTLIDETKAYESEIAKVDEIWGNLGWLSYWWSGQSLFKRYGNACREFYRCKTEAEALEFADNLIPQIQKSIAGLMSFVSKIAQRFGQALNDFDQKIAARIRDGEELLFNDTLVRYYQPATVRGVVDAMVTDRNAMFQQTAVVRDALINDRRLNGILTFKNFSERVAQVDLLDLLEKTCLDQARIIHDQLVGRQAITQILGEELMIRLRNALGADGAALNNFARQVILPTIPFLRFEPAQQNFNPQLAGAPAVGGQTQSPILIKRPSPPNLQTFVNSLDQAFRQVDINVQPPMDNYGRPHELSVISLTANFPLRYLIQVKLLEQRYRNLIDNPATGPLAKLELHTDDVAFNLPDLYVSTALPDAPAYLLLAEQLGILKLEQDPVTGLPLVVAYIGTGAAQQLLRLGDRLDAAINYLTPADFLLLQPEVDQRLAADYRHISNKNVLKAKLDDKLEQIKASLGGPLHPDFNRHRQAVLKAQQIVQQC